MFGTVNFVRYRTFPTSVWDPRPEGKKGAKDQRIKNFCSEQLDCGALLSLRYSETELRGGFGSFFCYR